MKEEKKMVKCLLLQNNTLLIATVEEVLGQIGEPDCRLIKPYLVDRSSLEITYWLDFTNQTDIMIRSDDVLTFVDPKGELLDKYLKQIE
jgi:hypothetical protein